MARHQLRQDPPVNRRETIASPHKLLEWTVGVGCSSHCSHHRSSRILELPNHSRGHNINIIIDDVRVHEKDGMEVKGVVVEAEAGVSARGCGIDYVGTAIAAEF